MADKDMQYDFTKNKRGLVYIIVNEKFTVEGCPDRCGAYTDYKNMKKLFKPLNLKLMTFYDKTGEQIKDILKRASKRRDLSDRPCFICVISSHGIQMPSVDLDQQSKNKKTIEHAILGTDGKHVLTSDLMGFFSEDQCPGWRGKPKLFFIQACRETTYSDSPDRSEGLDPGVAVQYVVPAKLSKPNLSDVPFEALDVIMDGYDTETTDGESEDEKDEKDRREKGHDHLKKRARSHVTQEKGNIQHTEAVTPTDRADAGKTSTRVDTEVEEADTLEVTAIPCHDDMLIMFASPPGKLAWRSTIEGGWLLANLYNVFKHYIYFKNIIQDQDFLTILIQVSQDVSLKETDIKDPKYHRMKIVPTIYHRLTREIVMSASKNTKLMQKVAEEKQKLAGKQN